MLPDPVFYQKHRWLYGAVIPLVLIWLGLHGFWTGRTFFPLTRGPSVYLSGNAGLAMSLTWIAGGIYLHLIKFHQDRFYGSRWLDITSKACLVILACGLLYASWKFLAETFG